MERHERVCIHRTNIEQAAFLMTSFVLVAQADLWPAELTHPPNPTSAHKALRSSCVSRNQSPLGESSPFPYSMFLINACFVNQITKIVLDLRAKGRRVRF